MRQMLGPLYDGEAIRLPELDLDDEYKRLMISKFHPSSHKKEITDFRSRERLAKIPPRTAATFESSPSAIEE